MSMTPYCKNELKILSILSLLSRLLFLIQPIPYHYFCGFQSCPLLYFNHWTPNRPQAARMDWPRLKQMTISTSFRCKIQVLIRLCFSTVLLWILAGTCHVSFSNPVSAAPDFPNNATTIHPVFSASS